MSTEDFAPSSPSRASSPPSLPYQVRTTCNRDCPDACGIVATVDAGPEGAPQIVRLQGDKTHPVTQGFLCYRTSHFLQQQNAPDRILTPHIRRDDVLVPTTWDDALDHIAAKLQAVKAAHGPGAIFHYRSGGNLGALLGVCDIFWDAFGPVTTKSGDICTGAPDAAQDEDFGGRDSNDLFDLERAKTIVIWGRNLFTSSPHTVPVIKRAQAGAMKTRVLVVDPTASRTSKMSDVFIQPRPGHDFALAMAVARALFDDGGVHPDAAQWCEDLDGFRALCQSKSRAEWEQWADVTPEQTDALANAFRDGPTSCIIGWGMGRRQDGAKTIRAVDALCAITGNIGVPGAGASTYFNRRGGIRKVADVVKDAFGHAFSPPPREISEPLFATALDPADTKVVWVTAGNPVAMLPGSERIAEKLREVEMTIVVDTWWTDTAHCADVVLPCATLLERDDVVTAYGHHYVGRARAVLAPAGEAKTDTDILRALAPRLGLDDILRRRGFFDDDTVWQRRLAAPLAAAGLSLEALDAGAQRSPVAPKIAWEGRKFATPTGRCHLVTTAPAAYREEVNASTAAPADFPLRLHSLSHPKSQSSQWVHAPGDEANPPPVCTVHPDAAPGYADGALARLRSAHGELVVRLQFDATQRADVALVPKGGGLAAKRCANALIAPALTDAGEGGALYDERVGLFPRS